MEALYKKWIATLEEYPFRQLTKQSDKLPAIQSIAAKMSLVVDDTYIPFVAMWRGNLKREASLAVATPFTNPTTGVIRRLGPLLVLMSDG